MIGGWYIGCGMVLAVKEITHGIEDTVWLQWGNEPQAYEFTIQYEESGRAYVRAFGNTWYMDECMKVE